MVLESRAQCFKIVLVVLFYFYHIPSFGQGATLQNKNKKVITKYFDDVINAHSLRRKGDYFQTDYMYHTMDGKHVRSNQDSGHNTILRWFFAAVPDVHYKIVHILAQDDMVAVYTTGTGIARSEMFGLPAAQKKVHFQQMFFYRLRDGKISEQWEAIDSEGVTKQLKEK